MPEVEPTFAENGGEVEDRRVRRQHHPNEEHLECSFFREQYVGQQELFLLRQHIHLRQADSTCWVASIISMKYTRN